jgi:ABC-type Fe3+-hydroxamate transport system substrate-binding protein
MKKILAIASVLVLCMVAVLAAGCTQTTPPATTPTPTPVATTEQPTPTPTPTIVSLTPGPTQTLPEIWSLEVQVQSNGVAIDPQMVVSCQGGKGLNFIQQIDVRVTRADGVVETGIIAKPLYKGKSVSLPITSQMGKVNRVEVWATTPQGDKVKIYDDNVPFRQY